MRVLVLFLACSFLVACASTVQKRELAEGKYYYRNGDYKTAFHRLLPLASEGNPQAEYAVGYLYYYGYGVPQDSETGKFWMARAASHGYAAAEKAMAMLGSVDNSPMPAKKS